MTLIEICVVFGFLILFAAIGLTSLKPAKEKAPTRGMAYALVEEFRAARQLAIANGHPVAVGIPTNEGTRPSTSIYRLTGWNIPKLDWARDYSRDFPNVSFAAASFVSSEGSHSTGVDTSTISKFGAFSINDWVPSQYQQDSLFVFMPDGGLVSNGLPALNNDYTIVIGKDASFSPTGNAFSVTAATEPMTIRVGVFGGLDIYTGLPGGSVAKGSSPSAVSQAEGYWEPAKGAGGKDEIYLSDVIVRPTLVGGEGKCKPGQTVNLEVFAYSPQGVELFARWNQEVLVGDSGKGFFSYPSDQLPLADSDGNTAKEMDRMEYIANFRSSDYSGVVWSGGAPNPEGQGVFRARWSWTVPLDSEPSDTYQVGVDVQNARGDAVIKNPPPEPEFETPEGGSVILEQMVGGIWQLVRMNPDGSGRKPISAPGVSEYLPTVDRNADNMAYLQGTGPNTRVMVRALDGSKPPQQLAGPGYFTSASISPNGNLVAYRDSVPGNVYVFDIGQNTTITLPNPVAGTEGRKTRPGWSWDSKFVVYEGPLSLYSYELATGNSTEIIAPIPHPTDEDPGLLEAPYCPVIYKEPVNGDDYMIFSVGNADPVMFVVPFNPLATHSPADFASYTRLGGGTFNSDTFNDDYPSVSADGTKVILTRSSEVEGIDSVNQELLVLQATGNGDGNFVGPPQSMGTGVRRGFFIP